MAKRTKSSREWLAEHDSGRYVKQARQAAPGARPPLVIPDMVPNTTGNADVDHDRSMHLVELSWNLPVSGCGREAIPGLGIPGRQLARVKVRKPDARAQRNPELYLPGRDFKA